MVEYQVVDTAAALQEAMERLVGGTGPIAVDTERASGFRYSQRAYLVQFYRRGSGTFLVDPPAFGRLDDLNSAIGDAEWVLHAASQDLACLREVGLDPARIFDTELAARLLGLPKVGLGTVVEDLLGVHLAKEHSAADWSKRPLPQSWLTYAALDVELLIDLRDVIERMLIENDKVTMALQEFQAELDAPPRPVRKDPWRRLSGIHSIKGARSLAVARSLWYARDDLARQRDIAPGRLVPDAALTAAAVAMPASKSELAALAAFTGRASRAELDRWWAAIEDGRATDDLPLLKVRDGSLPPARSWKDRNPPASARLHAARESLATLATDLSVPLENLVQPEAVRRLAWEPPETIDAGSIGERLAEGLARPWQIGLVAEPIAAAFVEADQAQALSTAVASPERPND